jgi:hypothetical protein
MDNIDKREARSEAKINSRFTKGGKGDAHRVAHKEYSEASLWCEHGRMRDKCKECGK